MAKRKSGLRGTLVFPARGSSSDVDKSIAEATDEIKETIYKSVGGLDVELNKTASVTANGTLVVEPSDGKDVMEKATVTVAVPLEANKAVTIDASQYDSPVEITPTSGNTAMQKTTVTVSNIPALEANKTTTIDASSYTESVEITPTSGKDAMEKTTVTVSNIPVVESSKAATIDVSNYSDPVEIEPTDGKDAMAKTVVSLSNIPAGATILYGWLCNNNYMYLDTSVAPSSGAALKQIDIAGQGTITIIAVVEEGDVYAKVSDTEFTVTYEQGGQSHTLTYTRDATNDVEVWNVPPSVETTKQATIDVSTYDPVNKPVITPTAGKQSMAEVEITLDNIPSPSGGVSKLYLGVDLSDSSAYITKDPSTLNVGDTFGLLDLIGIYGSENCYQCTVTDITLVGSNYGITYTPSISDHNYIEVGTENPIELI